MTFAFIDICTLGLSLRPIVVTWDYVLSMATKLYRSPLKSHKESPIGSFPANEGCHGRPIFQDLPFYQTCFPTI